MDFGMYSSGQTHAAVTGGGALPSALAPPMPLQAFQLSAAGAALYVPHSGPGVLGLPCDSDVARTTFISDRTFATPTSLKLAQAQGDVPPVQVGTAANQFVNYRALEASVSNRTNPVWSGTEAYSDDFANGFRPSAATQGFVAAPVRAEAVLGTVSIYGSTPVGGEILSTRPPLPTQSPSGLNLSFVSAAAVDRREAVCKLAHLNRVLVGHKLQQMAAMPASF